MNMVAPFPLRRTTELVPHVSDPQKYICKKTYQGEQLIKQQDFRDNGESYTRYFKKGVLTKAILHARDKTCFTFIKNKNGVLSKAKTITQYHNGRFDITSHKHVITVNGYPFAVKCCKQHKKLIKVSTMELI
jgi:hypothetical protein